MVIHSRQQPEALPADQLIGHEVHAPAVVHAGEATSAFEARAKVLAAAHAQHPERLVIGVPRPLRPAAEVWINPPENRPTVRTIELSCDSKFVQQVSQSH